MNNVMKVISDDLYVLLEFIIRQNGLNNSKVQKEVHIEIKDNFFQLIFPDYIEYINSGRSPGSKMPPTDAIIEWARQKGISTDNGTIWMIRQGIAKSGIAARPVLDQLFEQAEEEWIKDWAERVFEAIIEELIKWFK